MSRVNTIQETNRAITRKLPTAFVGSLDEALSCETYRVFVTGPVPSIGELWYLAEHGWTIYGDGHFPTLRRANPSRVIQWAAQWFGPVRSPERAAAWWAELDHQLRRTFNGAGLMSTPATTGRRLLMCSMDTEQFPPMSTDAQNLIRSMSGQGRIEMMPAPTALDERRRGWNRSKLSITEYDQRLSYTALMRGLPIGEPVRLDGVEAARWWANGDGYPVGKVLASWEAPGGWAPRPGILPAYGEHGGTVYPPSGTGWVDTIEADLSVRQGWRVNVTEAVCWPGVGEPMRCWRDRLGRLMNAGEGVYGSWYSHALRAVMLHTVGALHGSPRRRTLVGENPPDGADRLRRAGDVWAWSESTPAAWPEMSHPEWSSVIWARARRRLLDAPGVNGTRVGALHVEPGTVVALRTDAVYLAGTHEPWPDDGKPGRYRFRGSFMCDGWPRRSTDLLAAKRSSR